MPKALTGERVFLCLQRKPSQPSKNLGVFKCWEKREQSGNLLGTSSLSLSGESVGDCGAFFVVQ